jgi:hypothetical protein
MLAASTRTLLRGTGRTALPTMGAVRNLNVHEYISMELMQTHGIKTPECHVATTPNEAEHIYASRFASSK